MADLSGACGTRRGSLMNAGSFDAPLVCPGVDGTFWKSAWPLVGSMIFMLSMLSSGTLMASGRGESASAKTGHVARLCHALISVTLVGAPGACAVACAPSSLQGNGASAKKAPDRFSSLNKITANS
jgi:hypothetical protein